ncbi:variable surface lipoprotein [Mycoplasmopsis verecunda]|uniref:Uncharacterized protein n=1 Tax=Mycoplasmopsis verecunda TaxID=171291 RepID=A0A1T4KGD1_9BACT|nr:variable surface lipoprotein [Mycoplasmopsis verecunda]WPB54234.1 variable surface lipoprotein [Mycoplasmopsis verecunda]SJZ41474.1 hypothetical protein SAMN02745154_00054 [Mycoplasmopsis verecunda]
MKKFKTLLITLSGVSAAILPVVAASCGGGGTETKNPEKPGDGTNSTPVVNPTPVTPGNGDGTNPTSVVTPTPVTPGNGDGTNPTPVVTPTPVTPGNSDQGKTPPKQDPGTGGDDKKEVAKPALDIPAQDSSATSEVQAVNELGRKLMESKFEVTLNADETAKFLKKVEAVSTKYPTPQINYDYMSYKLTTGTGKASGDNVIGQEIPTLKDNKAQLANAKNPLYTNNKNKTNPSGFLTVELFKDKGYAIVTYKLAKYEGKDKPYTVSSLEFKLYVNFVKPVENKKENDDTKPGATPTVEDAVVKKLDQEGAKFVAEKVSVTLNAEDSAKLLESIKSEETKNKVGYDYKSYKLTTKVDGRNTSNYNIGDEIAFFKDNNVQMVNATTPHRVNSEGQTRYQTMVDAILSDDESKVTATFKFGSGNGAKDDWKVSSNSYQLEIKLTKATA